ncbi:MAG: DUF1653 domain-containing protein [Patescibacteria group bacterium]
MTDEQKVLEEAARRLQIKIGGLYRNFKNKQLYRVIAIAKHSETLEDLVIYEAHSYKNPLSDVWARPIGIFLEIDDRDGVKQSRFSLEEDSEAIL